MIHRLAMAAAAALVASAAHAQSVEIKDAVARVTVIPEARSDIKVEIVGGNPKLALRVRSLSGKTIVDGDLERRIRGCRGEGESFRVNVRGVGEVGYAEMPQIIVHAPRNVVIEAGGAVQGSIGRSASLSLGNAGCGDWTIGNVEGEARISQAGSGDTRMGSAGALRVRVAGSGDVAVADVRNGANLSIAGSGSASVRSASGPLEVSIAGSGDVLVGAGRVSTMKASVAGSGDVDFRGVADSLKASIAGSGNVHAGEVKGEVSKSIMGSGRVWVGA